MFSVTAVLVERDVLKAENERLRAELEYAYRCIAHGYEFGTFDFSVLRTRAKEYLADKDGGIGPWRELLETMMFGTKSATR